MVKLIVVVINMVLNDMIINKNITLFDLLSHVKINSILYPVNIILYCCFEFYNDHMHNF